MQRLVLISRHIADSAKIGSRIGRCSLTLNSFVMTSILTLHERVSALYHKVLKPPDWKLLLEDFICPPGTSISVGVNLNGLPRIVSLHFNPFITYFFLNLSARLTGQVGFLFNYKIFSKRTGSLEVKWSRGKIDFG